MNLIVPMAAIVAVAGCAHGWALLAIVAVCVVDKRSFWAWAGGISEITFERLNLRRRR